MEKQIICSICGEVISGDYYSSEPVVTKGTCCEKCRNEVVKPRVKFFLDAVFQTK
jgi:NAD-dependent SIR2 family protein deacetylase